MIVNMCMFTAETSCCSKPFPQCYTVKNYNMWLCEFIFFYIWLQHKRFLSVSLSCQVLCFYFVALLHDWMNWLDLTSAWTLHTFNRKLFYLVLLSEQRERERGSNVGFSPGAALNTCSQRWTIVFSIVPSSSVVTIATAGLAEVRMGLLTDNRQSTQTVESLISALVNQYKPACSQSDEDPSHVCHSAAVNK